MAITNKENTILPTLLFILFIFIFFILLLLSPIIKIPILFLSSQLFYHYIHHTFSTSHSFTFLFPTSNTLKKLLQIIYHNIYIYILSKKTILLHSPLSPLNITNLSNLLISSSFFIFNFISIVYIVSKFVSNIII